MDAASSMRSETGAGLVTPANPSVALDATQPAATVIKCCDQLVRHLFDIGLRLHTVRAVLEHGAAGDTESAAAVGEVLDDLDRLIRDAGLTMLTLNRDYDFGSANGRGPRRRR